MLTITRDKLSRAWGGIQPDTVSRALRNVNRATTGKKHVWYVADVLAASPARAGQSGAESVLALAVEDGQTFVGTDDDLSSVRALESWVGANCDGGAERIHQVRVSFFNGLSRAVRSSGFVSDVERLRLLILRESGILRFALTGEKTGLPTGLPTDWTEFSRQFALIHAAPSPFARELVAGEA